MVQPVSSEFPVAAGAGTLHEKERRGWVGVAGGWAP